MTHLLTIPPPEDVSRARWLADLRDTADRDLPAARRAALLRLVWEEAYLTRQGLVARVEALLWRGCFGRAERSAFARDIAAVRGLLAAAGHTLAYSRRPDQRGYYVAGRPPLDERLQRLIAGAVAEADPWQIAISRRLTRAQHFQQGRSMTELAERVATYRIRVRQPDLSAAQARRAARQGEVRG